MYYYAKTDHLGSTRILCHAANGKMMVDQGTDYYAFGLAHQLRATNTNRYLFSGKELQDQYLNGSKLMLYDFGARNYDPTIGRWFNIDPALQFANPYIYCANNPIMYIDPDGRLMNPVYDEEGYFLGTDELGPDGDPIIMEKRKFKPGMDHGSATSFDLGVDALKDGEAYHRFLQHYQNIPNMPGFNKRSSFGDWVSQGSAVTAVLGDYTGGSGSSFRLTNSRGELDFRYYGNGWKGNQWVKTQSMANLGKGIQSFGRGLGYIGVFASGMQTYQANTIDGQLEHGLDTVMGGIGLLPGVGTPVSLFWSFGGKQLHHQWVGEVLKPQVEMGIGGLISVQPFK